MAKDESNPFIVMVPGAWCCAVHWEPFTKQLQEVGFGYDVVVLPSVGVAADPGNTMRADATAVANSLRRATAGGRDAVLIMHSYGGVPGTEAAGMIHDEMSKESNGKSGKIQGLIYVTAQVPNKNEAPLEQAVLYGHPEITIVNDLIHPTGARRCFFQDMPPEEADRAVALMKPMAVSAWLQPTAHVDWTKHPIPCTYITCTSDASTPREWTEASVIRLRDAGAEVETKDVDAGHFPMMSQPRALLRLVRDAIGA